MSRSAPRRIFTNESRKKMFNGTKNEPVQYMEGSNNYEDEFEENS